jgi:uncharacterized protein YggE
MLGRAITISEGTQMNQPPTPYPAVREMAMQAKAGADVPVEAGSQELTFNVSVMFELH